MIKLSQVLVGHSNGENEAHTYSKELPLDSQLEHHMDQSTRAPRCPSRHLHEDWTTPIVIIGVSKHVRAMTIDH